VVVVPQRRRKKWFGEMRRQLGPIFHELARQKECRMIEGHVMPDPIHMCIEVPPKYAEASVIGCIKGKSAIAIARQFGGRDLTEDDEVKVERVMERVYDQRRSNHTRNAPNCFNFYF